MRFRRTTLALLSTVTLSVLASRTASANDEMQPTPERLVNQPAGLPPGQTCQSLAASPNTALAAGLRPQNLTCRPNNAAFANLVSDLGFAIAPTAFYPARTTGVAGFQVSLEASFTRINAERSVPSTTGDVKYWQQGSRGPEDQNTRQNSVVNGTPDGLIQVYALKARKGLPLGFELAGSLGYVANTPLWVGGGDIRWSMLEGFRTGVMGVLPDVSVGGGVRTLTGTSRFHLTTIGIDVRVSKQFALADTSQIIPSVGFQRLLIFGDSNVIDSTPAVDAVAQCGFSGLDATTGAATCRNKLADGSDANTDFGNNFTFDKVRVHRNRGLFALNYRYEIVWIGGQFAVDLSDPASENPGIVGSRQWTLSLEGGVHF